MSSQPSKAELRAEASKWFKCNGLLAKRAERENWDIKPQPGTLFQLTADVLREAESVRFYEKKVPNMQTSFFYQSSLYKKLSNQMHETENEFRCRFLEQLRKRPDSKVLL